MEFNKEVKEELEKRIKRLEDFIADKGIGSSYLSRAKRVQRNMNVAVFVGSLITIAGLAVWVLNSDKD